MHYVGIDLHKRDLVMAVETERGPVGKPQRIACRDEAQILARFKALRPFEAVIEASSSYRWLYERLAPLGTVVLAHPLKLRAIVAARAKTDKLDAAMLAKLLRADLVPRAYIAPARYQTLREFTRARARLSQAATGAMSQVHALLRAANVHPPFKKVFGVKGRKWLAGLDLGESAGFVRDELLRRLAHYRRELKALDARLGEMADRFPETAALEPLYGIGRYSALLIVAEFGEPERFDHRGQAGAYAGLTSRVHQSGGHDYHGGISKRGSPWLRWVLGQAAIKIVREDRRLRNFYTRVRKRSGRNKARTAVARKLAEICWVRLRRWHREQAARKA